MTRKNGMPAAPAASREPIPDDLEDIIEWIKREGLEGEVSAVLYENRGGRGMAHFHTFDTLDDVSVERIREMFGGGSYQVRFRRRGVGWIKQPSVRILAPAMQREWETQPTSSASTTDPQLAATLAAIQRTLEQLAKPANPTADLVGLATAMATAQAPLLAAIAEAKRPAGNDMAATMEVLIKAMEFGRGGGDGDGFGSVVKDFGKPLLELLNRATGQQQPNPAGELAPPPGAPAAPAPGTAPGWYTALQPMLPQLLHLARAHGDVDHWAEQIVSNADDPTLTWISAELDRREAFQEEFYRHVPDAVAHREWFDGFWDAIARELDELGEDTPDGDGEK